MPRRIFAAIVFALIAVSFAGQSLAQSAVPDRREVITRDVDFYGSDLDPLFDTTLQACRNLCFANTSCKAYTFNSRSNSCFPKSALSETQPYEGAISAEVFDTDPRVLAAAEARSTDPGFLRPGDLTQARIQATGIGARHPGGQWDVPAMLNAAQDRIAQEDYLNAMRWIGAAVARSDAADQWAEYARLSMLIPTQKQSDKRNYANRAFNAATNAYLRAPNDPSRVNALILMSEALEIMGRGRDMVPTLRLAERVQPREDVVTALDAAIAKYGFRITGHRADSDSAQPRLCAEFSEPLIKAGMDYTPFVRLPDPGLVVQPSGNQICIAGVQHGERYRVTFREGLPAASGEKLIRDVEIALYVRDRSPQVSFPGRAYVLPKAADTALPIETVNLTEVDLLLRRVSDRNLLRTMQDEYFGRPLSQYEDRIFNTEIAEELALPPVKVKPSITQVLLITVPTPLKYMMWKALSLVSAAPILPLRIVGLRFQFRSARVVSVPAKPP